MKRILLAAATVLAAFTAMGAEPASAAWNYSVWYWNGTGTSFTWSNTGKTIALVVGVTAQGVPLNSAKTANVTVNTRHRSEVSCFSSGFSWSLFGPDRAGTTVGGSANNSQSSACPSRTFQGGRGAIWQ